MKKPKSLFFKISSVFLIGGLLFFYYFVNQIKNNYNDLIKSETRILHVTQILTKETNSKNFILLKSLISKNGTISDSTRQLFNSITQGNDFLLKDIQSHVSGTPEFNSYNRIIASRKTYNNYFNQLLELSSSESKENLINYYNLNLEPSFNRYQDDIALFASHVKDFSLSSSQEIENEVNKKSKWILFFSGSPALIFLVLSGLLIVVVAFFFWIDKKIDLTK